MVIFNLLPWREYEKNYQREMFKRFLLITLFLTLFFILGMHLLFSHQIANVKDRINILNNEINHYHSMRIKKKNYVNKSLSILPKQFFMHREINKKIFISFEELQQTSICFTEMTRVGSTISFKGITHSVSDLTRFLGHWSVGSLFSEIHINQIEQQKEELVKFTFQVDERAHDENSEA
ncbi:MAG: hypothetical protein KIT56_07350 [Gammaproteobacteria bacterium]|nr:hypothetical protein [Gammaproteobacteria bacterium]MCW5583676.1 hypothetical protein [Gammaproteobacteria bacterium]